MARTLALLLLAPSALALRGDPPPTRRRAVLGAGAVFALSAAAAVAKDRSAADGYPLQRDWCGARLASLHTSSHLHAHLPIATHIADDLLFNARRRLIACPSS